MTRLTIVGMALVLGLTAATLASPLAAQVSSTAAATKLQVTSQPMTDPNGRPMPGRLLLIGRLTTADGQPVSNQAVLFYQVVDFFGPRDADLGTATTDSTGTAVVVFQPAQSGPQAIKAYFVGSTAYQAALTELTVTVATVVPPFESAPPPLALLRPWVPIGLGGLMLATWVTLLAVLVITMVRIASAAKGPVVTASPTKGEVERGSAS
jgi:hypothetical protein